MNPISTDITTYISMPTWNSLSNEQEKYQSKNRGRRNRSKNPNSDFES